MRALSPEQLRAASSTMTGPFLSRLHSGNLDGAARWIERHQLNQTAPDARSDGAVTVAQMEQMFLAAADR